ncbi:ABC transporter ATP-binding protein [Thermosulfuriphilus ammonigenes]|uniref:ABC transporter ATP-binding protein n=1 Tax=Thermosulfuriphilus ammonigenes TaxID=1936021 RepID=A0A6G7PXF1_9BACT|nr:ABC transporter ATP-binding protein [Thermosulfuriphilus ammonigenes]MBA2849289.1 lipoprotein-releasing system ATP-binding protein [Thermosulfuriphilus ammonigenes]QIJ72369.1 ABC transporter ATP-binding protein [Thermosulfuriphilus ammonigenes]HFB83529.1 ABC transporter ATP-binding protein [Thermodesulfatator sp.]
MPEVAIEVQDLEKTFVSDGHRVTVFSGLNLTIYSGEAVAIVGASGVGKTTLLHILGTLERPSRGRVWLFGQDVFSLSERELSRFRNQEIGFVFQFHHLLPEFTAQENVMIPCLIAGLPPAEAAKRAQGLLEAVSLGHRLDYRVGDLSGGEQQRVAIARALVLSPRLLLADEPTGNLDPKSGEKIGQLILDMNRAYHTTTVVVTHNLSLARRMDRCLGLSQGRVIELDKEHPWPDWE